jgi:hypothetical protein
VEKKLHNELHNLYYRPRDHMGELGMRLRIILKWILKKYGVRTWTGHNEFRIGSSDGFL